MRGCVTCMTNGGPRESFTYVESRKYYEHTRHIIVHASTIP